jgi:hypothetical protein
MLFSRKTRRTKDSKSESTCMVVCRTCAGAIPLSVHASGIAQEFSATCPTCCHRKIYQHVDIQLRTLAA